jgi:type IV pilus assembly protein PilY1
MQRWLAGALAWMLIAGQAVLPVYAQSVPPRLADSPIAAKVNAKPNIIYTLDDSGSMQLNYIPEYVVDAAPATAISTLVTGGTMIATATVASTAALNTGDWVTITGASPAGYNGYWQITVTDGTHFTYNVGAVLANANPRGNYTTASAYCRSGNYTTGCAPTIQGNNSFAAPPFFASEFNRMMYNPNVTYWPPVDETGNPRTTTNTDAKGNQGYTAAKWSSVERDPYYAMFTAATRDNLNAKVAVPLYCNTDWPVTAGRNLALNPDVADSNGQYLPTSGSYCRINGTKYDASPLSGAPAVLDTDTHYQYPWQSSSGATGAQYFYRQLNTKVLWCDKTSPWWPRAAGVITACDGGTPVMGPDTQQKCNAPAAQCNPTPALRNFTPSACKTPDPLYCKPNTGGSDGFSPGTGDPPECQKCTCDKDYTPTQGRCSVKTGVACSAPYGTLGTNPSCPDVPSTTITGCTGGTPVYAYNQVGTPACNSQMWDPSTNAPMSPAVTMEQDANDKGLVCRHNNQTYATGGVAGLFKYPSPAAGYPGDVTAAGAAAGQLGKFTVGATSGCPTVGTTIAIWRHYYTVDSVQFCDDKDLTPDAQWRGFGTGVCQAKNDLTTHKNVKYGKFTRHDLFPGNPLGYPNGRSWLAGGTPGPDNSESINYANWYAYYATRLNAAKTTSATAFSYLNAKGTDPVAYRVGFHTLGDEPAPYGGGTTLTTGTTLTAGTFVDVEDWDNVAPSFHRQAWYKSLFGIKVSNYKTPTLSAMLRVGNLFETGSAAGVDTSTVTPVPAAAKDPLDTPSGLLSCANNYHILFTDGVTNQVALPATAGQQDATIPMSLDAVAATSTTPDQTLANLKGGAAWPAPFLEDTPAVSDTIADIATHYWARDLRPALKNDVPSSSGKSTGPGVGDLDPAADVAWWQHVNFSAISFGTEGILDASDPRTTMNDVATGAKTWQWPDLTQPNSPTHPFGPAAGAVAVDDLWHGTVMGRGWFVSAKSPIEVSYGLASILAGIQNQRKSRAAAAFGGQVLTTTNNIIYQTTIEPGWAGDLLKVEIDPADGKEVKTWWQAGALLKAAMKAPVPGDEPWMDETKRRIVTLGVDVGSTGQLTGPGVPFRFASLKASQLGSLSPTASVQQRMIAYLRGGSTYGPGPKPEILEGVGIGQFRQRSGILGDISNAQAVIVGPPSYPYSDLTDPGYKAFVTAHKARPTQIVAAANDGMVHVFDAGPMSPVAAGGGDELFAYIPAALFKGAAGTASEDPTGIQALTYQDGGIPIYRHHMYVDSSPRMADVDLGNGTGNWHTIVVGGLGKGGNSYYALDLTSTSVPDEATAAAKVLWEWSDPDVRYTYGRPVITKVRDSGFPTGRWVVLVTSGYNNVSGIGKLYVLDARNGKLLSTISTGVGTGANPSGFAQIHAFVKDQKNQVAEQIYGGDLFGNLWRIDVSTADSYKTASAELFAQLKDGAGAPQPVTTAPQIEVDINNGINRYVFIGTGRLLDQDDFTNPSPPQQQTFYAIRDGTLDAMETSGLPIQPRVTMSPINPDGVSAIVGGAPNGWYEDLPATPPNAERVVVDVNADVNIAAYIGTQAQNDPCVISLPASLYARDYTTGRSLIVAGGIATHRISIAEGAVGGTLVGRVDPTTGVQSLGWLISQEIPGSKPIDIINPVTGPGNRLSWRLLNGQ